MTAVGDGQFPAACVALVSGGELVYIEGCTAAVVGGGEEQYVWQDQEAGAKKRVPVPGSPTSPSTALDPSTSVFSLASLSKPIVAALALLCVEEGELDLDADINRYLSLLVFGYM